MVTINEDPTLPPVLIAYKDHLRLDLSFPFYWTLNLIPRQGSQILAWATTDVVPGWYTQAGTSPFLLGWRYGEGYTWSLGDFSYHAGFWGYVDSYGADAYFAMLLYSTGRAIPEDVVFAHRLKERFYEYDDKKGYVISMVEFVEKFGANTNPLMVKVMAMYDRWEEARRLYIAQDYDGSWSLFDQLLLDIDSFTHDALRLKDKTLFWVYVSEWFIITATLLVAGFVLWSLMVGRRLYKIVDQTRLRPPPGETGAESPEYTSRKPHSPWWRTGEHSRLAVS